MIKLYTNKSQKLQKLSFFYTLNKYARPQHLAEFLSLIARESSSIESLISSLKTAVFFNTKGDENDSLPSVSIGERTENNLIYDKIKKENHENFSFLTEVHIQDFLHTLMNRKYCLNKLMKLINIVEFLPQMILLKLNKNSKILDEQNDIIIANFDMNYPKNIELTLEKIKNIALEINLPFEINIDNQTLYFYNVENFFNEIFKKQNKRLKFKECVKIRDFSNSDLKHKGKKTNNSYLNIEKIQIEKVLWEADEYHESLSFRTTFWVINYYCTQ